MLNFRKRLLILQFSTIVLFVLVLGGGSALLFVPALENLQRRHLIHLSSEAATDVAFMLQKLSLRMEGLDMESFHRRYGDLPVEKHFLEYFKKFPNHFTSVSLLDQKGNELIRLVKGQPAITYQNYQNLPIVQQALRKPNRVHVGTKLQNVQLGEPAVQLAYSYVNYFGDEFLGTLLVTLPLKKFEQLLLNNAQDEDATLTLVSERGDLLSYNHEQNHFAHLPLKIGTLPTRHQLFGQDLVLVSKPVAGANWQVVASVPWQVFHAGANRMWRLVFFVCLLAALMGILLSWKITALLMRNITQLVTFAERVGQGDYLHPLPLDSSEEFNRLNNAFNRMAGDLDRNRRSRDSLQKIIETVIDPLIVTDCQGLIIQLNQAALDLFSCSSARLEERPLAELFPEPPVILQRTEFIDGLLRSPVSNLETRVRDCQGKEIDVLFSSAPSGSGSAEFGVVCILKDATELMSVRAAHEKALFQAEEARRRIDVLLRSVPDGLVVTDPRGHIQMLNAPAEKLIEENPDKLVAELTAHLTAEKSKSWTIDVPLAQTERNRLRVVQAHASVIRDSTGHDNGRVMLLRDVSHERSMAQMKNEFISTAAHELRTPLTSILGYSELMLDPNNEHQFTADQRQEFLQEILSRAEILARIIDDLLSISRIESGQPLSLEIAPADISLIIEQVVKQFRLIAANHHYELNLPLEGRLVPVDRDRLRQVLENLLSNAVKYSDAGSLIKVRGRDHHNSYQVIIEDQGIGMTTVQVSQIFDKFYRADPGDTKTSGLGIGMSIVKQIIAGHRGQIDISSKPNEGTRIEIRLPTPLHIESGSGKPL